MKKLLSLLSVLTISGSAIPTTIAASPYPNQEETNTIVKDNENNSQQIDNLNNNNFSWWDTVSALWGIGIKKIEEVKDYLIENFNNIKNGLENLNINDLIKLFKNIEQYNDYNLSNKKIDFPLNRTNLETTNWIDNININPIKQENKWYSVPAAIQMILNHFNVNISEFNQNRIYSDLGGAGEQGIPVNLNVVNYINNIIQQHGQSEGINYYYHPLNHGFGSTQNEMLMFEFYITQSLFWNSPIAFAHSVGMGLNDPDVIIFTGIEVDQENPEITLFHYINSHDGTRETMYGWEIENFCSEESALIGVGNGFDFENEQIEFSTIYTPEEHKESGEITMEALNLNLTEHTGITSINQLHNFSNFKINDYKMRSVWNGHVDNQNGTTYNTKEIPLGSANWILEKKDYWQFWFAHATFWWYWETTAYYKKNTHNRNINDFFLKLDFKEWSKTLYSSHDVYLYFNAGTKILFNL